MSREEFEPTFSPYNGGIKCASSCTIKAARAYAQAQAKETRGNQFRMDAKKNGLKGRIRRPG